MILIGISGAAGSGKSTAAAYLSRRYDFNRLRFAAPLKQMIGVILEYAGMDDEEIKRRVDGDLKEDPCDALQGKSSRYAQQTLGTEWGRDLIGPALWVRLTEIQIELAQYRGENAVIEDVRFPDEAAMIRRQGGTVMQITGRGGIPGNHVSEQGVLGDIRFENTGTVESLYAYLDNLVAKSR